MKHVIRLVEILSIPGMPLSAHAACDRYSDSTLTPNAPATITVTDSQPAGDVDRTVTVPGNRTVLPLGAAYHKSGTVGPGTLISTATVNIT